MGSSTRSQSRHMCADRDGAADDGVADALLAFANFGVRAVVEEVEGTPEAFNEGGGCRGST